MNEQQGDEPWVNTRKPDSVDDSGAQYLKSLCDRRDAAVLNPFLSGDELPEPDGAGGMAAPTTAPGAAS